MYTFMVAFTDFPKKEKTAYIAEMALLSGFLMVAEEGFEPTTFGL